MIASRSTRMLIGLLVLSIMAAAVAPSVGATTIDAALDKLGTLFKEGLLTEAEFAEAKRRAFSNDESEVEVAPGGDRPAGAQQNSDVFLVSRKELGDLMAKAAEAREDALLARFAELKSELLSASSVSNRRVAPSAKSPPRRQLNENSASAVGSTTQPHLKADDGKIALGSAADVSLYRAPFEGGNDASSAERCHATCLRDNFAKHDDNKDGALDAAEIDDAITAECPSKDDEPYKCACDGACKKTVMTAFDVNTNEKLEYAELTGSLRTDNNLVAATFDGALKCPAGFWSIANGRICMTKKWQEKAKGHDAFEKCASMGCHVCMSKYGRRTCLLRC